MGAPEMSIDETVMRSRHSSRLVVVANRLPVRWDDDSGQWVTSPGGLVSALSPVLQSRSGDWVGWPGIAGGSPDAFEVDGISQVPVPLTESDIDLFYEGFCNGTVWPLYHDAIRPVELHRHWWRPYVEVNRKFAEVVASTAEPTDSIWVQDYQLQLVPGMLRSMGLSNRIGFFLHIPFPPVEIFGRLPWREKILEGLLGADVIGFQTHRSLVNFGRCARSFTSATGPAETLSFGTRTVTTETVPISIDSAQYVREASDPLARTAAAELRSELGDPDVIILGVDRLDYTKGIDQRLRAFETLLADRPDLRGRVVMIQVAVPSRQNVGEYQVIREEIERIVGRINGAYGGSGWVPVHYYYRSLERTELIAHYLAADVMLVTPLRDGMNLVAKEYVATRIEDTGTLVLSEFAGAAEELKGATIVNPYDVDGLAEVLGASIDADPAEQRSSMRLLRRRVERWDVHRWAAHCLESIEGIGDATL
ncbi:MAG TPA: trehalose-6-phosphate synthase [Acidimicrobiia bacterium]|jgi:trehalose 6-phosphate synthase